MVIHLVVLGGIPVGAQTGVITEDEIVDIREENQQMDVIVEQKQSIDTGDETDDIVQGQEVTGDQNQMISNPNKVGDNEQSEIDSINLEQSLEVHAEQSQSIENVEKVDAVQEQGLSVEYSQSLNVSQEDQQSQETLIKTDQNQSFKTENYTDFVEQTMKTEIETYQEGEIDLEENQNKNNQGTNIKTNLEHKSETTSNATFNQKQSVEVIADIEETEAEEVNIKAIADNGLEIIKEVSHYVIKIFQSIVVNDEEIDTYEGEFILDNNLPIQKSQEYRKEFNWGILSILNSVTVNTSVDNDLQSALSSIIKFNYFIEHSKHQNENEQPGDEEPENPGEDNRGEEEPENPDEDNQGEEAENPGGDNQGEEAENPGGDNPGEEERENPGKESPEPLRNKGKQKVYNGKQEYFIKNLINTFIDSDSDGVPNHLEIIKFKTDPFKEDTDDDGLSDGFEIMYHSATSFYFTFECMEYDWRDFVPSTEEKVQEDEEIEKWKEIRLSPLSNDADQNGILDHLEDFDGDRILNFEEQLQGKNPYIHNENESYVGPTGLELMDIMEKTKKGC